MGVIIPFPVWIIPFPVLKTNFGFIGRYGKYVKREVLFITGLEVGVMIPFPILKTNFELLG